jgi:hypothetical protein
MGMLATSDELRERYQRAFVSARGLHGQADAARAAGQVDYLAESEAVLNDGLVDAYGWLLGIKPVSPLTSLLAKVDPQTVRAEFEAAEAEQRAGERRFNERIQGNGRAYEVDTAASYANGVASALSWALTTTGVLSY